MSDKRGEMILFMTTLVKRKRVSRSEERSFNTVAVGGPRHKRSGAKRDCARHFAAIGGS